MLCHGESGDAGEAESASLSTSLLNLEQIKNIVKTGSLDMPPFDYLNEWEVDSVAQYVKQFQNK